MDVTVVGSGTVVPHAARVCSSYFVAAGDVRLILDCGPGALHHMARFGLPWSAATHVALSHFHVDHVGDVPALLFAMKYGLPEPRAAPLDVLGPAGLSAFLDRIAAAFGTFVTDPGFTVTTHELGSGRGLDPSPSVRIRAAPTPHTEASIAYRIEAPGASLGYTGDTGYSDDVADFLEGVDLLIAECSLPDDQAIDPHLTPSRVARLAGRARPRHLLLTHVYPQLEARDVAGLVRAAGWIGETAVAHDGLRIRLGG